MLRVGMRRSGNHVAGLGLVLGALAVGGCGGQGATPPARLPHALGVRLAGSASAISASLTRGDACAAARQERQLRQAVAAAVAAGEVPMALRGPLSDSVRSLAGEIRCVGPPPVTPPRDRKHGHQGDKHGHGNGQGDGGDGGGD
jgi:hypothetical protein